MKEENLVIGNSYRLFSIKNLIKKGLLVVKANGKIEDDQDELRILKAMIENWNNPILYKGKHPCYKFDQYTFKNGRRWSIRPEWVRCKIKTEKTK